MVPLAPRVLLQGWAPAGYRVGFLPATGACVSRCRTSVALCCCGLFLVIPAVSRSPEVSGPPVGVPCTSGCPGRRAAAPVCLRAPGPSAGGLRVEYSTLQRALGVARGKALRSPRRTSSRCAPTRASVGRVGPIPPCGVPQRVYPLRAGHLRHERHGAGLGVLAAPGCTPPAWGGTACPPAPPPGSLIVGFGTPLTLLLDLRDHGVCRTVTIASSQAASSNVPPPRHDRHRPRVQLRPTRCGGPGRHASPDRGFSVLAGARGGCPSGPLGLLALLGDDPAR
jgi:hypothetical protein